MSPSTCFISYSWDSPEHKVWVRKLAEHLQGKSLHVFLDQWDLHPGADLINYMETSIRDADYVLLVCTPDFANKANSGHGGVGYEKAIVTGEIFHNSGSVRKFIPILRAGEEHLSLPSYLKSRVYIDFRDESFLEVSLDELLRHVYHRSMFSRPPLGSEPTFQLDQAQQLTSAEVRTDVIGKNVYCVRCGAVPGQSSTCTGGYTAHDFRLG